MQKFLIRIFYFVLPLIPLSVIADYYISENLKKGFSSGAEFEVWNDIYNQKIKADIAIYGSSRAWVHINPEQFEKRLQKNTYNFGVDGHNFHIQYLRHREYFDFNPPPKLVILAVDEHSLSVRKDLYNKDQFLPYMLWNLDIWEFTRSYNGFSNFEFFVPLLRYNGKKELIEQSWRNSKIKNQRTKGYRGIEKSWNNDLAHAKMNRPNFEIVVDSSLITLLQKFIIDLKRENIDLVFVNTPQYIEGQKFVKNRKEILSTISSIAEEHSVPLYDYSSDSISFKKENFYNSLHLNMKGSKKFTEMFLADLLEKNEFKEKFTD